MDYGKEEMRDLNLEQNIRALKLFNKFYNNSYV